MATDVIIIGAGISGLMAAQQIRDAGKTLTILDKGRSVGGRLATRRIGNGIADHGAQFFTARSSEFQKQVDLWIADDLVSVWGHGWSDGSLKKTQGDGHPRYIAKAGMNSIAKHIASSVGKVQVETKVSSVVWQGNLWQVTDTEGHLYDSKVLIMTPPVPQSLDMLKGVQLTADDRQALERIQYGPCLCGMFVIDGDTDLPEPGALQNFENTVYWFADNRKKGISPEEGIVTMHVGAGYSRQHYDDPDEEILDFLRKELQNHLKKGTAIKEAQLKRWRYSVPLTTHPFDILHSRNMPLIFAGDAFGGRGRVEGAFLSGVKAGKEAVKLL